jgi:hypothetical protein
MACVLLCPTFVGIDESPLAASDDAANALFSVMRATFWATGEDLLRRLVSALSDTLHRNVVLAETVTTEGAPTAALGLWIAERGRDGFRYCVLPLSAARPDERAVVRAAAESIGRGLVRSFPVRSPSGQPLGQLVVESGARRVSAIAEAALLAPLCARAGAELARLTPQKPAGGCAARLIHMCAWCKGVRDARRSWQTIEEYIRTLTDAGFSHGICPDCARQTPLTGIDASRRRQ